MENLSTLDLVNLYNATFGKNVKIGSYSRAKMIEALAKVRPGEKAPIEFEPGSNEQTPYPAPEELPSREELLKQHRCPLCGGDPSSQTAAGEEGTFLGGSCQECHECGGGYHVLTGEPVILTKGPSGKKRRVLNPQGKINAKVDALKAAGYICSYDRPARLWIIEREGASEESEPLWMESRKFSAYHPAELVGYAKASIK